MFKNSWLSIGIDQQHSQYLCWHVQSFCALVQNILISHIKSCLSVGKKPLSFFLPPSSPPSPSLAYSPRSLYLHKGLFCAVSAPSWQADWGTVVPFSQGHFLTALCSSSTFNIPVAKFFSFTSPWVMVSRPFGLHPCCKVLQRQHTAGARVRFRLLRLFYNAFTDEARATLWPMSSLLTSDLARADMCVCYGNVCVTVSAGSCYVCVQMASSSELSRYLSPLSNHVLYSSACLQTDRVALPLGFNEAALKQALLRGLESYVCLNTTP